MEPYRIRRHPVSKSLTKMGFEKWLEEFEPVINQFDPNAAMSTDAGDDGIMFETYGEEVDFVFNYNPDYVWTYVDSDYDDHPIIVNGRWLVNRIGYFITKKAWTKETLVVLEWD